MIVVAATPTPNGDLHLGHLAGPYLAADVYARYQRAAGRQVRFVTCTDDNQTYVLSTAIRQGVTPQALCASATDQIERSLNAMGISIGPLPPIDDRYRQTVLAFVTDLYQAGRLRTRSVRLPYLAATDSYLYDGLMTGGCPVCLASSSGGACEECGHPNNFDELLRPAASTAPDQPVTYRRADILVLPMEEYRQRLERYFDDSGAVLRPHSRQLIRELLARPLPDIPITVPGRWGIPAPFAETPGQRLYPWIEGMPASMYATWWAGSDRSESVDAAWRAETGATLVYFHGFDNTYHWGLMDLVLLMAHGDRYQLPAANVCNEFYELDGAKFSTSRNHLIRAVDLLAGVPRDLVRFYLALTAPECQRTNFTRDALAQVTAERLVQPWQAVAAAVSLIAAGNPPRPLPTTADGRARAAAMAERLRLCYELPGLSISRAADTIASQLARLRADTGCAPGDLLLQVRILLCLAAPILIDVAERARAAGLDLSLRAELPTEIAAFELPRLTVADWPPKQAMAAASTTERSAP